MAFLTNASLLCTTSALSCNNKHDSTQCLCCSHVIFHYYIQCIEMITVVEMLMYIYTDLNSVCVSLTLIFLFALTQECKQNKPVCWSRCCFTICAEISFPIFIFELLIASLMRLGAS